MSQNRVEVVLSAKDQLSPALRNITRQGERFAAGLSAAYIGTLGLAVKSAIDFESAMSDVSKVMGLNRDETQELGGELLTMTRTLPFAAEGLAEIAAAGGQLGIAREDIENFVDLTARMGVAFDMTADKAGNAIARLSNVFSLSIDETETLGDVINHLSNNSASSANEIVKALTRVGGVSRTFGLATEETAALTSAIISLGFAPERTNTAISSILPRLQTASSQTNKFQEGLMMAGLGASQLEEAIRVDAISGLKMYIEALGQLDKQTRSAAIAAMFGQGVDTQVLNQLANDTTGLYEALGLVAEETSYAGSMTAEFEARAATTANQMQIFRNGLKEIGITLGGVVLPAVNDLLELVTPTIQKIADFGKANPEILKLGIVIAGVVAAVGPLLVGVGAIGSGIGAIASAISFVMPLIAGVGAVIGAIVSSPIALIVVAIGAAIAGAGIAIWQAWEPLKGFFSALWSSFVQAIQPVSPELNKLWSMVVGFGSAVKAAGQYVANIFVTGLRAVIPPGTQVNSIAQRMGQLFGEWVVGGVNAAKGAFQGIVGAIQAVGNAFSSVLGIVNSLISGVGSLSSRLANVSAGSIGSVARAVSTGGTANVAGTSRGRAERIGGAATGLLPNTRVGGLIGAAIAESRNAPSNSNLVMANDSEAILPIDQQNSLARALQDRSLNMLGAMQSTQAVTPSQTTPQSKQNIIHLGGITINTMSSNAREIVDEVIVELEERFRRYEAGFLT